MSPVKRLLVITHVPHYSRGGKYYAYGPYVREMDVWCDLFPEVVIAAPGKTGPAPDDGLQFSRDNVRQYSVPRSGGRTLASKLWQLCLLPLIVARLCAAMSRADAIHVRCPGNLGLLGVVLAPIFSRKLVTKYAGQWTGYPGEPRSVRWQRKLLSSWWWRHGVVTVYGQWPDQPQQVVPFFTSIMTAQQIQRAKAIASGDKPSSRGSAGFSMVFVGRLSKAKNVDVIIRATQNLVNAGIDARLQVVGQGAEYETLRKLCASCGVSDRVEFAGGVEYERVFDFYENADALVLASETEGWPKAIAEAMACGLVCVGSNRGLVPWMLAEQRGFTVEPGDVDGLTAVLQKLATDRQLCAAVSRQAAEFGQRYSLDSLRDSLAQLLSERWDTPVGPAPGCPSDGVGKASPSAIGSPRANVVLP